MTPKSLVKTEVLCAKVASGFVLAASAGLTAYHVTNTDDWQKMPATNAAFSAALALSVRRQFNNYRQLGIYAATKPREHNAAQLMQMSAQFWNIARPLTLVAVDGVAGPLGQPLISAFSVSQASVATLLAYQCKSAARRHAKQEAESAVAAAVAASKANTPQ